MEVLIITICVLAFIYLSDRRDKAEKERFREFVMASKSKDIIEYKDAIPEDGELPEEEKDEYVDLDQVEPKTLLNAIKSE